MQKEYTKIEFRCAQPFESCILTLIEHAIKGEFVCADFNGHTLYSDTVSMNSASLEVAGCTYFDKLQKKTPIWKI